MEGRERTGRVSVVPSVQPSFALEFACRLGEARYACLPDKARTDNIWLNLASCTGGKQSECDRECAVRKGYVPVDMN